MCVDGKDYASIITRWTEAICIFQETDVRGSNFCKII